MSADALRRYRFASQAHWGFGLRRRFEVRSNGALAAIPRLALHAERMKGDAAASVVAVSPDGTPYWRSSGTGDASAPSRLQWLDDSSHASTAFELSGALGTSPRWVVDRKGIWGFEPASARLTRVARTTLDSARTVDIAEAIIALGDANGVTFTISDIAGDRCSGLWVLACRRAVTDGHSDDVVVHLDAEGRLLRVITVPGQAGEAEQIAVTQRGTMLAVLAGRGRFLLLLDARSGRTIRLMPLNSLSLCWSAVRLASDGRDRLALYGRRKRTVRSPAPPASAAADAERFALYVFNGNGDSIDGPLSALFDSSPRGDTTIGFVRDIAIHHDSVWFATANGLWRLTSQSAAGARDSDSEFLTPLLRSPESDRGRGWLRAELAVDLPQGATLQAMLTGTTNARLAQDVGALIENATLSEDARITAAWSRFDADEVRCYTFAGPQSAATPIAIPLFEIEAPWLLLGFRIVTPPGIAPGTVRSLTVRYPNLSIVEQLPAIFRGRENDPDGFLRRLCGVLEATTHNLDARIRAIGPSLDANTAEESFLDYLAGWLGIPWGDGLAVDIKRRMLLVAGELGTHRGTRKGLEVLLRALLGEQAMVHISDLTVDHVITRLGGAGCSDTRLPALLAGTRSGTATLGGKAVLGRARLPCSANAADALDPLATIVPTLTIRISADRGARLAIEGVLDGLLRQFIPAGIRSFVQWRVRPASPNARPGDRILDALSPRTLGSDSVIGRTRLSGEGTARMRDGGLATGFTLR